MEEIWKRIPETDNYYVSNYGRVKIVKDGKEKPVKTYPDRDGYAKMQIYTNGINKTYRVHRLVGLLFIPNPENKPCLDHIDTNRMNARVDNLRWVTYSENNCNPLTLKHNAESHNKKIAQYTMDGVFIRCWASAREIERATGINHSSISKCCLGKIRYTHNFKFKFVN